MIACMRRRCLLTHIVATTCGFVSATRGGIFSALDFGAKADGRTNDTAAIQRAIDAAAGAGGGVAWLPPSKIYALGGGLHLLGHEYDGVSLRVDGDVVIPTLAWPTLKQCGLANASSGAAGIPQPLCSVLTVINVYRFKLWGHGSISGFLFDEHKEPRAPAGVFVINCTEVVIRDLRLNHLLGSIWLWNSQNALIENVSLVNRNEPEEAGNLEIGGIGSHGEPWNAPWQYEVPLMPANNITVRNSFFTGGDDNVCIKNDTSNVLVEGCEFQNGHGASIGSIPDCSGYYGVVTNITFRNIRMGGDAPMKIKWWPNTTGEISNILYEDVTLTNASKAIEIMANYGAWTCPCKWIHNFGGPDQKGKCRNYEWAGGSVGIGGNCGPEGDRTNNLNTRNITFRRIRGSVKQPGAISCRSGNPCNIILEDVTLLTLEQWVCGNAEVTSRGDVTPRLAFCPRGPGDSEELVV